VSLVNPMRENLHWKRLDVIVTGKQERYFLSNHILALLILNLRGLLIWMITKKKFLSLNISTKWTEDLGVCLEQGQAIGNYGLSREEKGFSPTLSSWWNTVTILKRACNYGHRCPWFHGWNALDNCGHSMSMAGITVTVLYDWPNHRTAHTIVPHN